MRGKFANADLSAEERAAIDKALADGKSKQCPPGEAKLKSWRDHVPGLLATGSARVTSRG